MCQEVHVNLKRLPDEVTILCFVLSAYGNLIFFGDLAIKLLDDRTQEVLHTFNRGKVGGGKKAAFLCSLQSMRRGWKIFEHPTICQGHIGKIAERTNYDAVVEHVQELEGQDGRVVHNDGSSSGDTTR